VNASEAEALGEPVARPSAWALSLTALSPALGAIAVAYFDTFRSMVAIWSRSDTYVHGYFILPISLYLVWIRRESLRALSPRADALALVPLFLAGLGWLAARLAGVLVAEQYFAVATIPLMVWAVLGPLVSRSILFPLGYLLLAVPVGEALIPYMIDYTAAFAVAALRFTGVPVLQEGNLLTLPNSQWSVVEACSGLRYLIACVTIGLLYAYLTYRSWWRRAAFIALSFAVPIVANWVRAYLIIYLGYASDMRLAVGIDHLIYGWIFYAVVMCLLLWVGSLFSDGTAPEASNGTAELVAGKPVPPRATALVAAGAVLAVASGPIWANVVDSVPVVPSVASFAFPDSMTGWARSGAPLDWEPPYVGASFSGGAVYQSGHERVALHVGLYPDQRQGEELVSSKNAIEPSQRGGHRAWGPGVEEWVVSGPRGKLLVWRFYWISGRSTPSPVVAKLMEAGERLRLRQPFAAGVTVSTDGEDVEGARVRLERFLSAGLPAIESALDEASQ
jgi:exosortase A